MRLEGDDHTPAAGAGSEGAAQPERGLGKPRVVHVTVAGFHVRCQACYMRFDDVTTWSDAVAACEALGPGTHLVTIGDAEENALVASILSPDSMWIGANDLEDEGTFVWITEEPLSYQNWASGEPNNVNGSEHCVVMRGADDSVATMWNDTFCGLARSYSCESEL